jgi:hypothetical protein
MIRGTKLRPSFGAKELMSRSFDPSLPVRIAGQRNPGLPTDACRFFYVPGCGARLRPKPGDCCVFCSYGSVPFPQCKPSVPAGLALPRAVPAEDQDERSRPGPGGMNSMREDQIGFTVDRR